MPDKLALIADEDTVLGFGSLGMDCHIAENASQAQSAFDEVMKKTYAVVFVTDTIARFLEESKPDFMKKAMIMVLPGCNTRNKMGLKELTAIVEKAVGISNIMDKA
ncbi:hypothetical protein JW926_10180 [Candidatus Sumerlaeota bacterium]|nr:hypothetical protein [Candidatus Sumerlaeota bacterium]